MQSTSLEMLDWMKHKLESRLLGEISITSDMQWRKKWQPTPVLLPRESRGQRRLVGCCPWGHTKSDTVSTVSPSICHEVMGPDVMIFVFWMLSFKPTFSLSSFTFINRLFSSSLCAKSVVSSAYLRLLIFLPEILIPACARRRPHNSPRKLI